MPDMSPPYVYVSPANGSTGLLRSARIVLRLEDRGTSKLNLPTLQVAVDSVPVITEGAVAVGGTWTSSYVHAWERGPAPAVAEVFLVRDALHAYGESIPVSVYVEDNAGNATSRVYSLSVESTPEYDGTDFGAVLAPVELSLITPFGNPIAETLRRRVLYGLVPGAVPESSLERQAVRRLVQLVFRYGQDPVMSRMWPDTPQYRGVRMPTARSVEDLLPLSGQFREAFKQALDTLSGYVDQVIAEHLRTVAVTNPVAAALVLATLLCFLRDNSGVLNG